MLEIEELAELPIDEATEKVLNDELLSVLIIYATLQKENPRTTVEDAERWMEKFPEMANTLIKVTIKVVLDMYKKGELDDN